MSDDLPRADVMFCDDIRVEVANKRSLMGVYFDAMFVGIPFPATIPKLCLLITYIDDIDEPHGEATIRVYLPGDPEDKPSAIAGIPVPDLIKNAPRKTPTGTDATKVIARLEIQFMPLVIKEAGKIRITATHSGGQFEIGKLDVAQSPTLILPSVPALSDNRSEDKANFTL